MSHSSGQGSGHGNGYDHAYSDSQSPTYAHPLPTGTTPTSATSTQYRPATIAELAERASLNLWDDSASSTKDFKAYLRLAERYRKEGKDAAKKGDYEHAFVMLAKAATLVLEKLPSHRDYQTVLTASQRSNLSLNGQDIIDLLQELKSTLVDRYEKWLQKHPEGGGSPAPGRAPGTSSAASSATLPPTSGITGESERTPNARTQRISQNGYDESQYGSSRTRTSQHPSSSSTSIDRERERDVQSDRDREQERHYQAQIAAQREQQRLAAEEAARWRQQREAREGMMKSEGGQAQGQGYASDGRIPREPSLQSSSSGQDLTFSKTPRQLNAQQYAQQQPAGQPTTAGYPHGSQSTMVISQPPQAQTQPFHPPPPSSSYSTSSYTTATSADPRTTQAETEGITRRLQEAEQTARAVRRDIALTQPVEYPTIHNPSSVASSSTARVPTVERQPSFPPRDLSSYMDGMSLSSGSSAAIPGPRMMPLENPLYEGDSTDSESVNSGFDGRRWHTPSHGNSHGKTSGDQRSPTRSTKSPHYGYPYPSPSYPPPITTTSPPPGPGLIRYPTLMSQHQKTQGYYPSLNSIFTEERSVGSGGLLFDSGSAQTQSRQQQPYLKPQPPLPPASIPPPPPPPPPVVVQPPTHVPADRIIRPSSPSYPSQAMPPPLKTVSVPKDCLHRFLAIARPNTDMNKETCGLLLGRDKGHKFVVTCLLIPKQHATSDTCTMDEEEGVMMFTEGRGLITLGWIHTHPSQSCFMSSVDLHTHSAFQRMLPESFAIVCAPKSTPAFGIFRLTDPPGLETILSCTAKEAFHPHPDLPIYTDADKGHVQMKDSASLEIVDLR